MLFSYPMSYVLPWVIPSIFCLITWGTSRIHSFPRAFLCFLFCLIPWMQWNVFLLFPFLLVILTKQWIYYIISISWGLPVTLERWMTGRNSTDTCPPASWGECSAEFLGICDCEMWNEEVIQAPLVTYMQFKIYLLNRSFIPLVDKLGYTHCTHNASSTLIYHLHSGSILCTSISLCPWGSYSCIYCGTSWPYSCIFSSWSRNH